jgi:hypothetical protein
LNLISKTEVWFWNSWWFVTLPCLIVWNSILKKKFRLSSKHKKCNSSYKRKNKKLKENE